MMKRGANKNACILQAVSNVDTFFDEYTRSQRILVSGSVSALRFELSKIKSCRNQTNFVKYLRYFVLIHDIGKKFKIGHFLTIFACQPELLYKSKTL